MADYVKLAGTAKRLIEANGRPVVVRRLGRQISDPNQPWLSSENVRNPADLEAQVQACFVDPVSAAKMGLGIFGEELVARIEAVALVAADSSTADLETCDELVELGTIFRIEHCEVLKPGPTKLLYIFLLISSGATPTTIQGSAFNAGFNVGFN